MENILWKITVFSYCQNRSVCLMFDTLSCPLCQSVTVCALCQYITVCPAGIAQWLECWTRDWKVAGSNPCRSGGRIFFSRVNFLCWLLFQYPFHPRVTTVAHKRSRSFCQNCRWQVTAKHAYTLCMWLCMKWHGAWLYGVHRTCAKMAAVSCGTSHQRCKYTTLVDIQKRAIKRSLLLM